MPVEPRTISDIAEDLVFHEGSEPFLGLSRIDLGSTITDPGVRTLFGTVHQTNTVRSFALRNATLHAPSMVLFSGDKKVPETRYQISDQNYESAYISDAVTITGQAPIIIGFNADWWGYYHWVVQCLPAIDMAMRWKAHSGARLALPNLYGWHADLLNLLGYGAVDRVEIDENRCYALPRAVYCEHLNGSTAFGISRTAVQTFQRLHKRARVRPSNHEMIYLARTDSPRRPMRNEEALIRFLESEGVAIVVPGLLSVIDQISLFSGAKIVIGAHGGAMTNIVFCPHDAIVYELLPSHYSNVCFNRLAQAKGLDYWADMFVSDGQGHEHQQSWSVDLEFFKRRFAEIREAAGPTPQSPATLPRGAATGELFAFFVRSGRSRPIDTWHHYFDIYEKYLVRLRGMNPTVVQLGVEEGGKLEMWREYFGGNRRLFGIDSNPDARRHEDVADKIFIGDQRDREFVRAVARKIGQTDVAINDGAHTANQQISAFEELYPTLAENGIYIVEDTHTSLWRGPLMDRADDQSFFVHACLRCAELMTWTGNLSNYPVLGTDHGVRL